MSPSRANNQGRTARLLERRVLRRIQAQKLIAPGTTLMVGVSGGPDSLCLLRVLTSLKEELQLSLHLAHLNHELRGEEAAADAGFVVALAQMLALPATVEGRDVAAYRRHHHLSLEEAAREVRYRFFAEVAAKVGAAAVAVGHTADDQAETILLHLIRGAGLAGLRGMQPRTELHPDPALPPLTVIRPLLEVSRRQTAAYCASLGLEPRSDSSNRTLNLRRNRLRAELIPLLASYNPNIVATLLRSGRSAAQALSYLDEQILGLWPELISEEPGTITIHRQMAQDLHPILQQRLLQLAAQRLVGEPAPLREAHIQGMANALEGRAGGELTLPHGLQFRVSYHTASLTLKRDSPTSTLEDEAEYIKQERVLHIPGTTELPFWRVEAEIRQGSEGATLPQGWQADFDLDAVRGQLSVRGRRPGDRFQPLGMAQPKKLQDFMVDEKIPRERRDSIPLVVSDRGIVWVVGWRIGEGAKVRATSRRRLRLTFQRR